MDFGFGIGDTGFSDFDVDVEEVMIKKVKSYDRIWKTGSGGSIDNNPLIKDGIIYFGALDGYVYAVDSIYGNTIWKFKTNDRINGSSPVIAGDLLFIGSYDGNLYAINILTHRAEWTFKTGGPIFGNPFSHEGKVYFGSRDGNVYCIAHTGKELWRYKTGKEVCTTPTVSDGKLVVGSYDHNLYCLDAGTGTELWRFRSNDEIINNQPFTFYKGMVYFGGHDGFLYAISMENGKMEWRFMTSKFGIGCGTPVYEGVIYFGDRENTFYALNAETGKEIWNFKTGHPIIAQKPIKYDNKIIFGCEDGNMYVLSSGGKELWRFRTGGRLYGAIALEGGKVYFGSWDCHLYCIDLDKREEVWRMTTSTTSKAEIPPVQDSFKMEIKKETQIEDAISEEKYESKKEKSASLSNYSIESEYASTSDYKTKSDYDTNFVMFEDVEQKEVLSWNSNSGDLTPGHSAISTPSWKT